MFGDKLIIGHSKGKICEKGRIFIPTFTSVEKHDQLVLNLVVINNKQGLKIYAYKEYLNIINRFKKLRENAQSFEEYEKYNAEIEKIIISLQGTLQIDSQKRLLLPKELMQELDWSCHDLIQFDGLGESLLIQKI